MVEFVDYVVFVVKLLVSVDLVHVVDLGGFNMQVVKQTSYGELIDVTRYSVYLSSTEYNDIREFLNLICIPYPTGSEEETLRLRIVGLLNHYQYYRLKNLCSQFNLELR